MADIAEYGRLVREPGETEATRLALLRNHYERLSTELAERLAQLTHVAAKIRDYETFGERGSSLEAHACGDERLPLPARPGA